MSAILFPTWNRHIAVFSFRAVVVKNSSGKEVGSATTTHTVEIPATGHTPVVDAGVAAALAEKSYHAIEKPTFGSLELVEICEEEQYEQVELVGLVSNICVLSNAVLVKTALPEAEVIVDASCTACADPVMNEKALDIMEGLQITVINR